jgi:hypothetical protein
MMTLLSGLYLTPFDDLDEILSRQSQIEKEKLHALQIRPHKASEVAAAIAKIRDSAGRAET